nr:copia protein [Tanacetum cinerariifolium]
NLNACKVGKETVSAQQYVLLPLWSTGLQDPQNTDADVAEAAFDVKDNENDVHVSPSGKFSFNSTNRVNAVITPVTAAVPNPTNSTNSFNTASPFDTAVSPNFEIAKKSSFVDPSKYLDDPDMPELEDIVYSDDEEHLMLPLWVSWYIRWMSKMLFFMEPLNKRGKIDQTLCIKKKKGDILLVQVYVDDIIFGSTNKELCKAFEKLMKDKFQMCYIGELTFFLGLQIKQKDDGIFIGQDKYVAKILRKFGFRDVKSASTPIETEKHLLKDPAVLIEAQHHISNDSPQLGVNTTRCDEDSIELKELMVFMDVIKRDIRLDDADGVECLPNEEIFAKLAHMSYEKPPPKLTFYKAFFSTQWKFLIHTLVHMVRNVDSLSKFLMYLQFLQVVINNQVEYLTSHNTKYTSHALTHKVFTNIRRVGKGFSGVKTPLFASMLVQPQPQAEGEEQEVEMPTYPTPPSPTTSPSPLQDPTPTPHATPPALPPQEQPTTTYESSMSLLNTLMETCATLSQKVIKLEQDKHTQALEIIKLEKRVKKLEKKKRSKMHPNRGKIKAINADEDITLVDVETQEEIVTMDAELQGRINQDDNNAATKDVNATEPTVFDDEEVTMTMAHTLIKLKVEKAKLLDEQMAQRLHDEEVKKAIIRVGGITKAYQSFEDMLKGFDREDLVSLWSLVKEKFSTIVPSIDKEKALWVELKRLFKPDADDVLWKLQRHDMFMLTDKDYPLSNAVMTLMLSAKLQVEEDNEMARDLVMKIFIEANKPKSKSLDTSTK